MKTSLLTITLGLLFIPLLTAQASRQWANSEGLTMEASFIGTLERNGDTFVIFSKDDGIRYQFPMSSLSEADQDYIRSGQASRDANSSAVSAANSNPSTPTARDKTDFEQKISRNLVQLSGSSRVSRVRPDDFGPHDYYAIYFSAAWCPPCRTFTPKLVDFYNQQKALHGDKFEIIFVSRDRDDKAMQKYIADYKMAWPAVDHSRVGSARELQALSGRGIPCLVLVDKNGNVLSHSYEGETYVGPTKVMNDLGDRLGKDKS